MLFYLRISSSLLWQLVMIVFVVIVTVAVTLPHNCLQQYAYRTLLSWWVFVAAGALAMLIALATVSFKALKAALSNPVTIIKNHKFGDYCLDGFGWSNRANSNKIFIIL